MDYRKVYRHWIEHESLDQTLKKQLFELNGYEKEIEDCFYTSLSFGTAGMRGMMGVGPNRLNKYTIRKAAQGLAQSISKLGREYQQRGVVIAYDSRHQSFDFAKEAGLVLAANGVKAFVFPSLCSTPELSFAVRHLHATAGIVITASHNPSIYNGFKVYGSDGAQITAELAEQITQEISKVPDELQVKVANWNKAQEQQLFVWVESDVTEAYQQKLHAIALQPKGSNHDFKVIYTPLHGTGSKPVQKILNDRGFKQVYTVFEQDVPDPNFSTVLSPNPEEPEALKMAVELAQQNDADLVIGTDPDADRVGVSIRDKSGQWIVLTGNQVGALLLDYVLSQRKKQGILPANGAMIKTIVTSEMGRAIADQYGIETWDTLTGFKYIAEKIKHWDETKEYQFLFGYEESAGYLIGDFCRDKDAIQTSMLIVEMSAYYKHKGFKLYEILLKLYKKVGYFQEDMIPITLSGKIGQQKINYLMEYLRSNFPSSISGLAVMERKDYMQNIEDLPKSNVLKFVLEDGSWFVARPSGTEPKMKFYFGVKDVSLSNTNRKLKMFKTIVGDLRELLINEDLLFL
ncbi:phospho-sugar mutase [Shimazuella kribbensis]|uniref:phospho-sugar mutase n=1 Tax=Shimazuella kribbensis TaxID=139808 RepID=UPI00040C7FB5|nr:phospho-sugar mutase [Shimazuella kribbensis]